EMHQAFNFAFLVTDWEAGELRAQIAATLELGGWPTWVLSNHDVIRHASRLGYPVGTRLPYGLGAQDAQPDRELGLRRARAATLLMLALPGSAYLYQGEELGLPEVCDLPDEARQDYVWLSSGGRERGRDGARVPLPWDNELPAFGFSPTGRSWLPQPAYYGPLSVKQQAAAGSTLGLYREALRLRGKLRLGRRELSWVDSAPGVLAILREDVLVLANTSPSAVCVDLPAPARVLISSSPEPFNSQTLVTAAVPADTTWWLRLSATDSAIAQEAKSRGSGSNDICGSKG
ncbi:MAG: alpha-amylase family glycosyl hydrolase, partial [Candidatus Nanopelagicales bacterium]